MKRRWRSAQAVQAATDYVGRALRAGNALGGGAVTVLGHLQAAPER